jgi:hypothetical protein
MEAKMKVTNFFTYICSRKETDSHWELQKYLGNDDFQIVCLSPYNISDVANYLNDRQLEIIEIWCNKMHHKGLHPKQAEKNIFKDLQEFHMNLFSTLSEIMATMVIEPEDFPGNNMMKYNNLN